MKNRTKINVLVGSCAAALAIYIVGPIVFVKANKSTIIIASVVGGCLTGFAIPLLGKPSG
jgi:hypothetical protein